jgi:superoxide dismutase, Fe-Mn family
MFELKKLPYNYDALEPFFDEKTMRIHHGKHHQGYVDKLNKTLEGVPEFYEQSVEEILSNLKNVPKEIHQKVINFGGGVANHNLFWETLKKNDGAKPSEELANAINNSFGSFESFKEKFSDTANTLFGSGWVWLVVSNDKLEIIGLPNQDSPLSVGKKPILTLDVWEHAYYIKYFNRRDEYVKNFWNVVNWERVSELYSGSLQ